MTTPRVTVPVEPTPDLTNEQIQSVMLEAIREVRATVTDHVEAATMDADIARMERGPVDMGTTGWEVMRAVHRRLAALSAAPAPGGAVEWEAKDQELIERGLRTIRTYDAVRYLRDALSATTARLTGYDWNADPDGVTKQQGEAFSAADRVFADLDAAVASHPEIELPECQACGGTGKIEEAARTAGANQHSACVRTCDDCDGCGFAPDDEPEAPATREEAPAEAGEYQVGEFIGRQPVLCRHGSTDPNNLCDYCEGDKVWPGRAQPQARDGEGGTLDPAFVAWLKERDCLPNDDDGTIEWADIVCALNDWEADLTQAREDAQPVAWRYRLIDKRGPGRWSLVYTETRAREPWAGLDREVQPLYTHPAPDALRVAVEALELAAIRFDEIYEAAEVDDVAYRNEATIHGINGNADVAQSEVRQALAALQAEQKGGA